VVNEQYGLNDKPKLSKMVVFGLQWLAVAIPFIIIIGNVASGGQANIPYLQKIFLLVGVLILIQIFWGHRLPLIMGPSAVLLIAILNSSNQGIGNINSSIMIGGLILSLLAITGLFKHVKKLFTPLVIIVVLILISFSMIPTIISLISSGNLAISVYNFLFSLIFIMVIFTAHTFLEDMWKSTLTLSALFSGTIIYYIIFGSSNALNLKLSFIGIPQSIIGPLSVPDIGVFTAFLVSFLALAINDLSSMESVGTVLKADKMEKRVKNGVTITGLGNSVSGLFGVIGPVNYSISHGLIAATGMASRFTFIPTAIALLILAFSPMAIGIMSDITSPVIGVILLYILTTQIGASLLRVVENDGLKTIDDGMIIALPVILGTSIAFLPSEVVYKLPEIIRPVLANGFVMGTLIVIILEHLRHIKRPTSEK